jgi:putative hemolysin
MTQNSDQYSVFLAKTDEHLRAAQALRYDVFVREMGSDGPLVDHGAGLEIDRFDPFFDHLLVRENATQMIVGVYRMLRCDQAARAGQFYGEDEYDLSKLKSTGRKLLELGRSCLHRDHRGGPAMFYLWKGLADYVAHHQIEILFGVASFPGTDITAIAEPLSMLHHNHLAPADLRVRTLSDVYQPMDLIPVDQIDRRRATVAVPSLIKAYLRLGGFVGDGAYVDRVFNTTDVCLIVDTLRMNSRQRRLYGAD